MRKTRTHPAMALLAALPLLLGCNDSSMAPENPEEENESGFTTGFQPRANLTIEPRELELALGETHQLTPKWRTGQGAIYETAATEGPDPPIRWFTDDDAVAAVSQEGVVEGVARGEVFIRAVSGDNQAWARVKVR